MTKYLILSISLLLLSPLVIAHSHIHVCGKKWLYCVELPTAQRQNCIFYGNIHAETRWVWLALSCVPKESSDVKCIGVCNKTSCCEGDNCIALTFSEWGAQCNPDN